MPEALLQGADLDKVQWEQPTAQVPQHYAVEPPMEVERPVLKVPLVELHLVAELIVVKLPAVQVAVKVKPLAEKSVHWSKAREHRVSW
jgi:hypothetical protein